MKNLVRILPTVGAAFAITLTTIFVLPSKTLEAALTPVNPSPFAEPDLFAGLSSNPQGNIMDTLFGAGNYTRVDDSADQQWMNLIGSARIRALFGSESDLYYNSISHPDLFVAAPPSSGYTNGSWVALPSTSESFNWKIINNPNGTFSSIQSQNGGNDRMVTFQITGNSGHPSNVLGDYVLGWEAGAGFPSDGDYQDLVVEVSSVSPIPEPSSLVLLGIGMLGVAGLIRRKRA